MSAKTMSAVIDLVDVKKTFTMHLQGGLHLWHATPPAKRDGR